MEPRSLLKMLQTEQGLLYTYYFYFVPVFCSACCTTPINGCSAALMVQVRLTP